ncbi:sigma-70 family RNA polymerase sigma factor [Planococcus versutus]|uniref:RNA polymerase subunit sigma-24 n=1 Tax=Planococcus versutus TaxID=1302659 RepID=A0A1B1S397_9BACL|nr:sigma-70 family RNA polymerase sigma factor [Planococcus versutus]ANU27658.1 RNA polymerase subunit sigma-24 [Planococcus versutus]
MKNFEDVAIQYAPMISALIRKLHIYRDFDAFRQTGNIALWQAWQRFEDEKGNFTPFAYQSIRGAMLDELKRETKRNEQLIPKEYDVQEKFAEELNDSLPEWLHMCRLTVQEKQLLEALYVQGCTLTELAKHENISLAGMKKRRERLLKKLRHITPHPFQTYDVNTANRSIESYEEI